jgi:hypothetical protein
MNHVPYFDAHRNTRAAQAASPVHVEQHTNDFPYIIQLPDGRMVAADHDGRPMVDNQGRMQAFSRPDSMSNQQRRDTVQAIRNVNGVSGYVTTDADARAAHDAVEARRIVTKYGDPDFGIVRP